MTVEEAKKVCDILVSLAGADSSPSLHRDLFILAQLGAVPCKEWRFQGSLGFGGKFYETPVRWYVDCYPEDLTPERDRVIQDTNKALEALRVRGVVQVLGE